MARDMYSEETWEQLIDPAVLTSDTNGSSLDLAGYDSGTIVVAVGECGNAATISATNKIEFEIEESANDSDWSDVDDADIIGEVSGTNDGCFGVIDSSTEDDACFTVHYIGDKRYIRPVINFSGTHATGTPIGAIGVGRGYKYPPA